jgi:DNA-3-methyladenine glycosylase I
MDTNKTCSWPGNNPLMIAYHNKEWGVPLHDDQKIFEFMVLDAFQAGLSWAIVLKKRKGFKKAFDHFDHKKIARYDEIKIQELIRDENIIRNQLKNKSGRE